MYNNNNWFDTGYLIASQTLKFPQISDDHKSSQTMKKGGHPMGYQDKLLQCSDCSTTFTFSAQEQEQFATRGYTNEPKRCLPCREARKARQNGGNNYSSGSYGNRSYSSAPRQMFSIKCSTCGKDAQVPFEPRGDRPVYCSDCYRKTNPGNRY